ncbi:proteasome subunit beta [Actinoallomurus purpureus]|uniref:proteasome subunit beta n=1 Tax=Actinoallomurus purpureus TaxID=478114 RepID=UPI002093F50C|nr:proteasome subunit beta [Actinoallomurus purpureus]MCO6005462.1 proteasome subunit beta [Actinoallomurus purpureus]
MVDFSRGLPPAFLSSANASFSRLLAECAPEALPTGRVRESVAGLPIPHGTTILALTFEGGVLMAGDRRATMGNLIAQRDLEKVNFADEYSAVAFAGTVGTAMDMVRLFQFELEHYEKIEERRLSLDGKARRLASLVQDNLGAAMQGLVVVPLFAGYDLDRGVGRIYSFDVTGGPYEMADFHSDGSGSPYARGSLKKLYRPGMSQDDAVIAAVQALYDAADDDSATGGPDLTRRIYPSIAVVTEDGYRRLSEDEVRTVAEAVVAARHDSPNGPIAPVR